ncbi:ubiquitin-2 like Rad60 SUMO-like-domain-containing protein [Dichotomocladium elegans]|nr:ubiquitin-2 like Rad60 SUMO-like-domain-containing protein [Dichotomocladium elegans]
MSGFDIASFRDKLPRSNSRRPTFELESTDSGSSESESDEPKKNRKNKRVFADFSQRRWSDSDKEEEEKHTEDAQVDSATNNTHAPSLLSAPSPPPTFEDKPIENSENCILLSDEEIESSLLLKRPSTPSSQLPSSSKRPRTVVPSVPELEDLDPDLAVIQPNPVPPSPYLQSTSVGEELSPAPSAPQKVLIKVIYNTPQSSDDPAAKQFIEALRKPMVICVNDIDPFEKLLTHYARHKRLTKDRLQLVYKDIPVVLRATPASLGMIPGKFKNELHVYVKDDYQRRYREELEKKKEMEEMFDKPLEQSYREESEGLQEQSEDQERLFLKLRGKDNEDVVVRVKKTTTLRNVLKQYCVAKMLPDDMFDKINLSFEGENLPLDECVGDTDLEDQDMVTVTIKV